MQWCSRFHEAVKPALFHLACSALIALLAASLVFGAWYPSPYDQLAGGRDLLRYIVLVDVICGPLLTFLVFDRQKSRRALVTDIGAIVLLQLLALGYGLHSMAQARPVFLAYEGSRYRLVSAADVDKESLPLARPEFQSLPLTGPQWIGVRVSQETDRDFPASVQLSLAGLHSAFRPQRWVPYDNQVDAVRAALLPLENLLAKHPDDRELVNAALLKHGLKPQQVGYLPLSAEKASSPDWVVLVERKSGEPSGFLPLDGW